MGSTTFQEARRIPSKFTRHNWQAAPDRAGKIDPVRNPKTGKFSMRFKFTLDSGKVTP